jgi:hypothetical protein
LKAFRAGGFNDGRSGCPIDDEERVAAAKTWLRHTGICSLSYKSPRNS